MSTSKCMNCHWWTTADMKAKEQSGVLAISKGRCHLRAPSLVQWGNHGDLDYDTKWPTTDGGDYCGEWRSRDDRAARLLGTKYMTGADGEAA